MNRKHEYFTVEQLTHQEIVSHPPRHLYPQERDWTCCFACVRTLLSGLADSVPSEDDIVRDHRLIPGPHYSRDVKRLGLLDACEAVYGCDHPDTDFDDVLTLAENGSFVMLECMLNYAHWVVLLGYYPLADGGVENSQLLIYDPYFDQVRLMNTYEFISMWRDGNYEHSRVDKDFIAIRAKQA